MADPLIDFLVQNSFLIYMFFLNLFFLIVFLRLRMTLGPFFVQTVKVSFGFMKDPNMFLHFLNSKVAVLEWRSYNQVIKLDPEDPTSELVYVDRENGFSPATPTMKSKGFLNIFNKTPALDRLDYVYSDDFVPVKLNKGNFYMFGRQMHVVYEGQNITQNPLANYSQDSQVKKAGIAVEHQLIANKLLAESEFRNKIATKDDVKLYGLLNLILLGFGIVALIVMVIGLQSGVDAATKIITEAYNNYKPALDSFLNNIPRVVPQ